MASPGLCGHAEPKAAGGVAEALRLDQPPESCFLKALPPGNPDVAPLSAPQKSVRTPQTPSQEHHV